MFIEERQQLILEQLEKEKKVIAPELALKLNVSLDTIRRDLMVLEENGLLKRTRGGAVPALEMKIIKPKYHTGRDIKDINPYYDAIAKAACTYINEKDTVFLGGSSIDHLMIKYLPKNFDFTIVTNSIITADELRHFDNIETYIACGKVRGHGNMRDSLTLDFINNMRIDKAFISGPTLSAEFGLSNTSFEVSKLQKTIIEAARKSICLVPNIKLGTEAFAKIIDTKEIDVLITDWEAVEEEVTKITDLGVEVIVCKEN